VPTATRRRRACSIAVSRPGAAHGTLRDLLITFECDYSNPAARFSPAAAYVQLKVLNHDPRGEDYRRWVFRDFVVRGVCERA